MPIAIEVFGTPSGAAPLRIDVNGTAWAWVEAAELPEKLAEIGRAYVSGDLARLLRDQQET